jgi:D-xylose 1-dehydrogenase (NADP+, D-xylono-1,5-lactone-forming)
MGPVRWGILGAADIAKRALIPAMRAAGAEIVAVGSRDRHAAGAMAQAFGIPAAYASYQEVLDDPQVEAVYVPLPNSLHVEWTVRACEARKHVLCEKPMALTVGEVDEVSSAAERNGVRVMEGVMYHFHPQTERLIQLIRQGALGTIQAVNIAFTYHLGNPSDIRLNAALGGGVLQDIGTYCVSLCRLALAEEPDGFTALARLAPTGADNQFTALMTFPSGRIASFFCSATGARQQLASVVGDEAAATLTAPFIGGPADCILNVRRGWVRGQESDEELRIAGADPYRLMVEHFDGVIRNGGELRVSLAETRANTDALAKLALAAGIRYF